MVRPNDDSNLSRCRRLDVDVRRSSAIVRAWTGSEVHDQQSRRVTFGECTRFDGRLRPFSLNIAHYPGVGSHDRAHDWAQEGDWLGDWLGWILVVLHMQHWIRSRAGEYGLILVGYGRSY